VVQVVFFVLQVRQPQQVKDDISEVLVGKRHAVRVFPSPEEGGIAPELLVLAVGMGHIEAEAVDAAIQPEANYFMDGLSYLRLYQFKSGCSFRKECR